MSLKNIKFKNVHIKLEKLYKLDNYITHLVEDKFSSDDPEKIIILWQILVTEYCLI